MRKILISIKNKYLIAFAIFLVFILFFDRNDFFVQLERKKELTELKQSKAYYEAEIEKNKKILMELETNAEALEKFAREKYFLKKENEDVFIIQE